MKQVFSLDISFSMKYARVIQASGRGIHAPHLVPCPEELGMLYLSDYNYLSSE
jgi:hypothetical protein